MKRSQIISLLCSAACPALLAAPHRAAAAPTEIRACGTTLATPGDYVLTQDIGPCSGTGIAIAASDVNLRLAGHSITGAQTATGCSSGASQVGIQIQPGTGRVVVSGGSVTRFSDGVTVAGTGHELRALRLLDNCATGAAVQGDSHSLGRLQVLGNRVGIRLCATQATFIADSEISRNSLYGVELSCPGGANGNDIAQSILAGNGTAASAGGAIGVLGGASNTMRDNAIVNNFAGITLVDADASRIGGNDVQGNTTAGIALGVGSSGNEIRFNDARGNSVDFSEANACDVNLFEANDFGTGSGCVPTGTAPIAVDSCGTTLSAPGSYVLARDIGPCPGTGIAIAASDVSLQLAGHTITGAQTATLCSPGAPQAGIQIRSGTANVRVRGGSVSRFTNGLDVAGSAHELRALRMLDNCASGAAVQGDSHLLSRVQAQGSRTGLLLCATSFVTVSSSEISRNSQNGIELGCAGGTMANGISGSLLSANGTSAGGGAIRDAVSSGNEFDFNAILNNASGITLVDATQTSLAFNDVQGNATTGIAVGAGSSDNGIGLNTARGNAVDLSEDNACDVNFWSSNDYAVGVGCVQ